MATVTKTTSVYTQHPRIPGLFSLHDEELDEVIRDIVIDAPMLEALGNPGRITVTIQPGDTLNGYDS